MTKIWPFSFYFFYYAGMAFLMPFLVLFYQGLLFTGTQIAMLTGIPPMITLFGAPFWTNVADATRRHRLVMSLGLGVSIAAVLLLQYLDTFVVIFITILIFNFFFSPVAPLSDSATLNMLGKDKSMYGRVRLGGTIGWGLFALIAGMLISNLGLKITFWGFGLFTFINLIVAQKLVHGESTAQGRLSSGGIQFFLKSRRWLLFLLSAFLGGLGAFSVAVYLAPYMAEMGANESTIGVAIMIATVTELPIFFFGNRLLRRFNSQALFVLALVLMGIRSISYALVRTSTGVLVIQVFGGMIFPAMWLAGVAYADEHAPEGLKSTAQGLFGATSFGFGAAVGGFTAGILLESIGGRGMYLVFGLIILGGLAVIEVLKRILPKEEVPQTA